MNKMLNTERVDCLGTMHETYMNCGLSGLAPVIPHGHTERG